jgi:hypothetical protein
MVFSCIPKAPYRNKTAKDAEPEKVQLDGYADSRLFDLVGHYAQDERIPLSECVALLVAKAFKRPDLASVPRKRLGRRRKDQVSRT